MAFPTSELLAKKFTEPPEYIKDGILGEGQVLILGAPVSSYKSIVAINMAHCLSLGKKLFNSFDVVKPTRVLFLDAEVGTYYFHQRLKMFYEKEKAPEWWIASKEDKGTQFRIDQRLTLKPLYKEIEEIKPNVIILDCLNPFLSDEEGEQTFSRTADNVNFLQHKYPSLGLSFIIIHHMREIQPGSDPLSWYNIRGHGKLVDWPATRITMVRRRRKDEKEKHKLTMRFLLRHGPDRPDLNLIVDENLHVSRRQGLAAL